MTVAGVNGTTPSGEATTRQLTLGLGSKAVAKALATFTNASTISIVDIRQAAVESSLKTEILDLLRPQHGPKNMPTLLLYDERGLQIFEKVNFIIEFVGLG